MKNGWQAKVVAYIKNNDGPRVFTRAQLIKTLDELRENIGLPASLRPNQFIQALIDCTEIAEIAVEPANQSIQTGMPYRSFNRYIRKNASPIEIALSLRAGSYASHGTAALTHDLVPEMKDVYVNKEQSVKPTNDSQLTQASIDRAFANKPRTTNYIYLFKQTRLFLLNGKNTGDFGVTEVITPTGMPLRATSINRTLVDITVRPTYAGGISNVLNAFRKAGDRISIPELVATLKRIDHVYPYHQAIGFYLQAAGFSRARLKPIFELGTQFDFYLDYKMTSPDYDSYWKLYFPKKLLSN